MVVMGCVTARPTPPAPPRHAELGLGIATTTLNNGLRVVLVRDPSAADVEVTMRYRVGSVDDGPAPGIAHMAEHLMFQQVLGSQTLFANLEQIATYFNGLTTYDATTYISRAPAAYLDRLLTIEGVRLGLRCTSVSDAVFAREREVVINEIRERDDETSLLGVLHSAVYPEGHPYRANIGGSIDTLSALTRDQVCAFVDQHYAPSNAVLVVSGNVTAAELNASLSKLLARASKREVVAQAPVPRLVAAAEHTEVAAPIDDDALLISWPLPDSPLLRTQIRAIAPALPALIQSKISGQAIAIELGDSRAPSFAIVVAPSTDTTLAEVRRETEQAIKSLPLVFATTRIREIDQLAFDRVQQSAIYELYSSLEDARTRDVQLATYVLEGVDPKIALKLAFEGVRGLTPDTSMEIAKQYLGLERAKVVTLKSSGKRRGHDIVVRPAIHDMGQRRSVPDLEEAHRAASREPFRLPGVVSRRLANGMRVVLLPTSTVPTVDVRLVFGSGTADEGRDKRGVATIAARALDWNWMYLNDLLLFVAAGGENDVSIDSDHTSFSVVGVDMHIDYLLAGLRRWVRDGMYDRGVAPYVYALRRAAHSDRNRPVQTAWTSALYGPSHPYALAEPSATIVDEDVESFRRDHYTPDNATLVISGHFDPALANQWVDYLFDDWTGHHTPPTTVAPPTPSAASFALIDDIDQLQLHVALPVSTHSRAQELVAAAMLDEIANDVRHQLGASYGVDAVLDESRLDAHYELGGAIDVSRAQEAIHLLDDRVAELRTDATVTSRAFIAARNRVLTQLTPSTIHALASSVEQDVALGREPLTGIEVADEVRKLTVENMTTALSDLDMTHATVFMRGPQPAIDETFAAMGRTPDVLKRNLVGTDNDDDEQKTEYSSSRRVDFGDTLTEQPLTLAGWTFTLAPGLFSEHVGGNDIKMNVSDVDCCAGAGVVVEVGRHVDKKTDVGLRLGASFASGKRTIMYQAVDYDVNISSYDVAAYLRTLGYDRLWGALYVGLHIDDLSYETSVGTSETTMPKGVAIGIEGGVDVVKLHGHRIGVLASAMGTMPSGTGSFMIGLAYRR
jgi:zinc protease